MIGLFFNGIAALYWLATLVRIFLAWKPKARLEQLSATCEKIFLVLLTAALVFYINQLNIVNGQVQSLYYSRPISWLLFTWCLNAANLVSELVYGNQRSALFANLWTSLSLTLLPTTHTKSLTNLFDNDVQWLGIHRLFFLLGYAFCILAFPLVLQYFWKSFSIQQLAAPERTIQEQTLWRLDRMSYRMILWALPLLTIGIVLEALLLLEHHELPSPTQIWTDKKETFLALATWFTCGIYLHSRLFFSWKNRRSALFYFLCLVLILIGHLSSHLF